MLWRLLADLLVAVHCGITLFIALGSLLVLRWPRVAWVHLPFALWGACVEVFNIVCPLTPLENHLRRLGGEAGYSGGFIEHYLLPVLYPDGLTRNIQFALGAFVVVLNAVVYTMAWRRRVSRRAENAPTSGGRAPASP
jgi:hypothetical protein